MCTRNGGRGRGKDCLCVCVCMRAGIGELWTRIVEVHFIILPSQAVRQCQILEGGFGSWIWVFTVVCTNVLDLYIVHDCKR